jgi:hypothetical protein
MGESRAPIGLVLIGVVGGLATILANIATQAIPEAWKPYLWVAWPLFGACVAAGIVLAIRQRRTEAEAEGSQPAQSVFEQKAEGSYIAQAGPGWVAKVVIIHPQTGRRIPLQRPPRAAHFTGREDEVCVREVLMHLLNERSQFR